MSAEKINSGVYRTGETGIETQPRIKTPSARYGTIWAHAVAADAYQSQGVRYDNFRNALADAGYPHHAGDYCASAYKVSGNAYNFGNSDHVTAIGAGFTRLTAGMGAKSGKFYGAGASMGTMGLLNYALANPTNVGALVLWIPVLDLEGIYINNTLGYQSNIATAYGVTAPNPIPNGTRATNDPNYYGAAALGSTPILMITSDDDPVGTTTSQAQTWATGRSNITVQSQGSIGHVVPLNADPQTIVTFFDANGGRG